ncbi:hypothetical protein A8C56_10120 [Niabella ginsenosidivorans]|uniref:Beta-lactamase-related domain-containing protein n=1 Tax=Niabella ginsenosidivorans TaxID=1176587 RepID=A0A1A9IB92_9BACT|nr:hypothetical protein A8C56_10120 [Niabella ginsenosidivorans]
MYREGQFNGNVLIIDHGKEIYRKAIGFANAARNIPLSLDYRFHIGSIAKEFDAVGIMMLKEAGKLSLNDPVSKFFPQLPHWAHKITVRNLLQYTSGLPEVNYSSVHGDKDNWDELYNLDTLKFEPGSRYDYNNNNTFLRRQVIKKITGLDFRDFVERQLVKPAAMFHVVVDPTDREPLMARSFNDDFKQDSLIPPISGWTAVTLDDLYNWSESINNFKLISPETTKELLTPYQDHAQTGLGNGAMSGNKITVHLHDGSLLHYQAILWYDAANDRTIILLNSRRHNNIYEIARRVEEILDK